MLCEDRTFECFLEDIVKLTTERWPWVKKSLSVLKKGRPWRNASATTRIYQKSTFSRSWESDHLNEIWTSTALHFSFSPSSTDRFITWDWNHHRSSIWSMTISRTSTFKDYITWPIIKTSADKSANTIRSDSYDYFSIAWVGRPDHSMLRVKGLRIIVVHLVDLFIVEPHESTDEWKSDDHFSPVWRLATYISSRCRVSRCSICGTLVASSQLSICQGHSLCTRIWVLACCRAAYHSFGMVDE